MDLLHLVGIDNAGYRSKEKLLDSHLVGNRNNVAHGEWYVMESDDYIDLHNTIVGLMNRFRNDLEDAVSTESYRLA